MKIHASNRILSQFFVALVCIYSQNIQAIDLRPQYLKITISAEDDVLSRSEIKPIIVTFTNLDSRAHHIVLPGNKTSGNDLIYLKYFKVEGNFYRDVYTEPRTLQLDTSAKGNIDLQELEAGASISIPIFFNDSINASRHIQARHLIPDLENGEYQLQLCYNPWDEELASYFYQKTQFGFDRNIKQDTNKIEIDAEGICSNYLTIQISDAIHTQKETPENDCLCQLIAAEKWNAVKNYLKGETIENDQFKNDWLESECVFWAYPMPAAMLSSLPSFNGRFLILRAKEKYHYAYVNWQFGEVYVARMRMNQLGHLIGIRRSIIPSSNHTKIKLLNFSVF